MHLHYDNGCLNSQRQACVDLICRREIARHRYFDFHVVGARVMFGKPSWVSISYRK